MIKKKSISCLLLLHIICTVSIFADPDVTILQYNAIRSMPNYFYADDEFILLGVIYVEGMDIIFAYNKHIWGESRRMTGRILLFDSGGVIKGMYGVINEQPVIMDKKLLFPVKEEYGNIIDFSHGIPEKARIDGEVISYKRIPNL
jgi:hypothetical protein